MPLPSSSDALWSGR